MESSNSPSEISPERYQEIAREWLQRFEKCVRKRSYVTCRDLFFRSVVWFGLETNITSSLDQLVEDEFKKTWPGQLAFTLDMKRCAVMPGDPVTIGCAWSASNVIAGAPQKNGRITITLALFERNRILCVHGHQSYCLDNCQWETNQEQQSNTRRNVYGYLNNVKMTAAQIGRVVGKHSSFIARQIKKGFYANNSCIS